MAFLLALFVLPLVSFADSFEQHEADDLNEASARIGMPEEYDSTAVQVSSPPAPTDTNTSPGTSEISLVLVIQGSTQGSQKWTAVTQVSVTDADGALVLDAVVQGTWTKYYSDATVEAVSAECISDSNGNCTLSLSQAQVVIRPLLLIDR